MEEGDVVDGSEERKFRRANESSKVGGVCAGLAYWLEIPVWIVRLICILTILGYGGGLILYLLLWLVVPEWSEEPDDFQGVID